MIVEYESNNSDGDWWLTDENWLSLEVAGWVVAWGERYFCHSSWEPAPAGKPEPHGLDERCGGHRRADSLKETIEKSLTFLGAGATRATINVDSEATAIKLWEKATGLDAFAPGCACCGAPHRFNTIHADDAP